MTTATKTPPRHRGDMILPDELKGLPPAIDEANRAAIEAQDRLEAVAATTRAARKEAELAPRVDREAQQAAAAAGKPVPEATAPAKAEAAAAAVADLHAHERAAENAIRHLNRVVEANYDAHLAGRREAFEAEAGAFAELVEQALDRLVGFRVEAAAYTAAQEFPTTGAVFAGADPDRARKEYAKALGRRRQARAHPSIVDALADLTVAIEEVSR